MTADLCQGASNRVDVSVIIPSYQSSKTLNKCLEAVTAQHTRLRYEVIVVHTGREQIPDETRLKFGSVHFYTFETRWLPGKARNWAAKRSQSPWVLFLDADCVVGEDWVETIVSEAIRHKADAVGGAVRNATPWSLTSWAMHILEFGEWLPGGKPGFCTNFPSCNALYKRCVLLAAGGFPESLFPCEDTILNHVLRSMQYRLVFLPQCVVGHIHCRNTIDVLRHNYAHGLAHGRGCRVYKLPGHFLIRFNRASILVIVVLGRFLRVALRLVPRHLLAFLLLFASAPLVALSLATWAMGFADAIKYAANDFDRDSVSFHEVNPSTVDPQI
jgi:GT2 family glycosyltransferase